MCFLAFVSVLIPMMSTDAVGLNMDVVPSVRLEEGWNSNVYNTPINEVSSFGTRLTPALALRFTSQDNAMIQVSGNYENIWYYDAQAKDANSHTWFVRVDSSGAWGLTPTLSMVPSVYYLNTTNASRRTQLVPSGDPVLPPVSITNYGSTNTEDFGGALNFEYLATQNVIIGVGGNYTEQRFTDSLPGSGLTDSSTAGGAASVSYIFSPRTRLGIIAAGTHQTYQNSPDADTMFGGILFGYQFSPAFSLYGTFGMSHIRQSEAPGIPSQSESKPSGRFNILYVRETFTARAYGSADYYGGGGFGAATRQWTAGLDFTDQFTVNWSWNLSGAYQVSQSVFETDAVDLTTIYGTGRLRYQLLSWASVDLTGNLNRQRSNGQFGETLDLYSVLVGISIEKPYRIY